MEMNFKCEPRTRQAEIPDTFHLYKTEKIKMTHG